MKKWLLGALTALLCTLLYCGSVSGLVTSVVGSDPLFALNVRMQDAILQSPRLPDPNIFVVGIDEETLRELGPWNSWTRDRMAQLIETLTADPATAPAVIGIDVSYFSTTQPQYDDALAAAAAKAGNVVVACEAVFADTVRYDPSGNPYISRMEVAQMDYPYPALREVTASGVINTLPDSDGVIRSSIFQLGQGDSTVYSFSYEIYKRYAQKAGLAPTLSPPLDSLGRFPISYSAVSGDYYSGYSFVRVLRGEIPSAAFAGGVVLIGPYATGMMDQYYTPLEKGALMYGVEIHANALQALIEQNFKQTVPVAVQAVLLFAVLFGLYLLLLRLDPRLSTLLIVAMVLLFLAAAVPLYNAGYIISLVYLPVFAAVLYLYRMIYAYFVERMNRQMVTETFKRYMEPQLVEHLLKNPEARSSMQGAKRDIAVLFVDVRGFTPMSEALDTADVVAILNEYLSAAAGAIFANRGTLDKFIGDAAMAIFNAPLDLPDYTYLAVKAGWELASQSQELGARLQQRFGRNVSFGIGINCGEAIVGNIGADFRRDYTAIGDTVNTAARLESRAKPGQILISEAVKTRLEGRILTTCIGPMELKGKQQQLTVYQVDGLI